jgi:hypothetical protein
MDGSKIVNIEKNNNIDAFKVIFTIPFSEFEKATTRDGHYGKTFKLGNIIFYDYVKDHVKSF